MTDLPVQDLPAQELPAREAMEFDVVIVGAGPAGLAAAIRLKQINPDVTVVIVEKGSEVGAHILSGAVVDPVGLDKLLPEWRSEDTPIKTAVTDDRFYFLTASGGMRLPNFLMPPLMNNHGNFIVSLGSVCRWLATKAEALGVEIYPGFAAAEVLFDESGAVAGIATGDMGVSKNGEPKDNFTRGMELRGKYTLFAEGARGNLGKQLIAKFGLSEGREPQKFGLGLKELWQTAPAKHRQGLVQHSFGWPLDGTTGGGSFLYHFDDNLVSVGFDAGFMNVPRIKGSHNAMLSGMMAAETAASALSAGRSHDALTDYDAAWRASSFGKDLWRVRNAKPLWSKLGTLLGIALGGFDMWCNTLGFSLFGTLKHGKPDYATLKPAAECSPIAYPRPDGKLTFDRLSSVFLSNTNHEEDQPVHLC